LKQFTCLFNVDIHTYVGIGAVAEWAFVLAKS
jgi:hypothetical protein